MTTLSPSPRFFAIAVTAGLTSVVPAIAGAHLWPLWLVSISVVILLFCLDAVLAPRRRHLEVELEVPTPLSVGVEQTADLHCRSSYGRVRSTEARFECPPDLGFPNQVALTLDGDGHDTQVPLRPRRRGTTSIDAVWFRYTGPLGLARRCLRISLELQVKVISSIHAVRALALAFSNPREQMHGLKIERYTGDGSNFHAMRQYHPGLDLQSVDWKASARHRRLLCREFRAERNHHVVLAIDTGRLMAEEIHRLPRLDHAIHAAMLLALMSLRTGDRVSLYSFAATPGALTSAVAGTNSLHTLLDTSTSLNYSDEETNFTLGLTQLAGNLTRRSMVVVLTDFVDTVAAELMIENIRRLARIHLVVFAAMRNPEIERITDAMPRSMSDVERVVVADALARDRRTVIRRLQRLGIHCVDARPEDLGGGLVHRYLEIKRREMV
jgi:uncharacterized protein (DUF58 family)